MIVDLFKQGFCLNGIALFFYCQGFVQSALGQQLQLKSFGSVYFKGRYLVQIPNACLVNDVLGDPKKTIKQTDSRGRLSLQGFVIPTCLLSLDPFLLP